MFSGVDAADERGILVVGTDVLEAPAPRLTRGAAPPVVLSPWLALLLVAAADAGVPAFVPPRAPAAQRPPPSLVAPRDTADSVPERAYDLRRADDGSGELVHDAGHFEARIARDGVVTFKDRSISKRAFQLPWLPARLAPGTPTVEGTVRRMLKRRGPKKPPPPAEMDDSFLPLPNGTRYRPDPREACQFPRSCYYEAALVQVAVTGKLDITDEIIRLSGGDPYRDEKARFLTATREMRIQLASRAHADAIRRAETELPALVEAVALDSRRSCRERAALLAALRDELDAATEQGRLARERVTMLLETRFAPRAHSTDAGVTTTRRCRDDE